MHTISIQAAQERDLPSILEIYNDAVLNTTAIWNERLSDLDDRLSWWNARRDAGFPVLVAHVEGPSASSHASSQCAGYATYGSFRPNDGYKHSRELSVYVAKAHLGHGIAYAMMAALEAQARQEDVHVLVGGIEATNTASLALHQKCGFSQSAHLPQVGRKFGRWLDLVLMTKVLD